jgi:23S rRNA (adenine2503-C2)-methyltransferase
MEFILSRAGPVAPGAGGGSVRAAHEAHRSAASVVFHLSAIAPPDAANPFGQLIIGIVSFTGLSFDRLAALLGSRTRAVAARRWLYRGGPVPSDLPGRIPGVNTAAWDAVRAAAPLPPWRLSQREAAADGTVKYAIDLAGATVETVLIPTRGRSTVCVSSQAGCSRSCTFCATATLGLRRSLDAGEILLQYAVAAADAPPGSPARNVVFMGMGEPMDNLDAVLEAVDRLLEAPWPGLSPAHVTVSTSGVLPGMKRFLREGRGHLALSLNATTDDQRQRLVPHNRTWPIAALLDALREDRVLHPDRRSFIEYVLWEGVNDTDADVTRLAALLQGLDAQVNLIPHNAFPASGLRPPSDQEVRRFQRDLKRLGIASIVRWPRGRDIAAACGQLAGRAGSPSAGA